MQQHQDQVVALMREVLAEEYVHLLVEKVVIEEDLKEQSTSIACEVIHESSGERSVIAGKGVGLIDALFSGVVARFAQEYPSLKTIRFSSFKIQGRLETRHGYSGSDSKADVTLEISNSEERLFTFTGSSRSVTSSAVLTTLAGLEYFINSERAFVALYHALKDAKQRNRSDLAQRYTNSMAILVQNTSYSEVIGRIRQDLG